MASLARMRRLARRRRLSPWQLRPYTWEERRIMNDSEPAHRNDSSRLREHPDTRFAATQHEFDLRAVAQEMTAEPVRRGQRQKALYHHGRLTIALFTFAPGAGLPDHV